MKKRTPNKYEIMSQKRIRWLIDEYCDGQQAAFAKKAGIGKSSVSQYVNGTNFPNNITAGIIARAFNMNPAWIMGFDVNQYAIEEQSEEEDNTISISMQKHIDIIREEKERFGLYMSDKEILLVKAYRTASDKDKRVVDSVLELDEKMEQEKAKLS